MTAQTILSQTASKTSKIEALLKLGYSRAQVAEMTQSGYGFVQNVYAKFAATEAGKLQRYLALQSEIAEKQVELKALGQEIIGIANGKKVHHEPGNKHYEFQVKHRRGFEYSEETEQLEISLKARKKREEENGTARLVTGTDYISIIK